MVFRLVNLGDQRANRRSSHFKHCNAACACDAPCVAGEGIRPSFTSPHHSACVYSNTLVDHVEQRSWRENAHILEVPRQINRAGSRRSRSDESASHARNGSIVRHEAIARKQHTVCVCVLRPDRTAPFSIAREESKYRRHTDSQRHDRANCHRRSFSGLSRTRVLRDYNKIIINYR